MLRKLGGSGMQDFGRREKLRGTVVGKKPNGKLGELRAMCKRLKQSLDFKGFCKQIEIDRTQPI